MKRFPFRQVDVFASEAVKGNALAVVFGADALGDARMAAFANWTNLSETVFLLEPTTPAADYRLRIFTTEQELPFAGHPTIGSCHAWLEAGGQPRGAEIVQECGAGLVRIRRDGDRLAFAAPPLLREGPVDEALVGRIAEGLGIEPDAIVASAWTDNGPGWVAIMLRDRADVLALAPDYAALRGLRVGVIAPWGGDADFEVRAFLAGDGMPEDPVTGSLNAGIAQWLIGAGLAPDHYVVSQGTVLGRSGRVYVERIGTDIWIGGHAVTCIEGSVAL